MGDDPRTSVVNADCRSWDILNLWICDGSVFPTVGGVNPSLTIQAIACRTADRIRGEIKTSRSRTKGKHASPMLISKTDRGSRSACAG
jgi:choline dehydrogenase-like flavoprotein